MDKVGADSSFEDAFYFSVVTFLTIGYGDLSPASDAGKIFFLLYCISSLVLQLTIVSELVSSTISFRPTDPEDLEGGPRRVSLALPSLSPCLISLNGLPDYFRPLQYDSASVLQILH